MNSEKGLGGQREMIKINGKLFADMIIQGAQNLSNNAT